MSYGLQIKGTPHLRDVEFEATYHIVGFLDICAEHLLPAAQRCFALRVACGRVASALPMICPRKALPTHRSTHPPHSLRSSQPQGGRLQRCVRALYVLPPRSLAWSDPRAPGLSDPYCLLSLGSSKARTRVVKKTLSPKWNQTFRLYVLRPTQASQRVSYQIFHHDPCSQTPAEGFLSPLFRPLLIHPTQTPSRFPATRFILVAHHVPPVRSVRTRSSSSRAGTRTPSRRTTSWASSPST